MTAPMIARRALNLSVAAVVTLFIMVGDNVSASKILLFSSQFRSHLIMHASIGEALVQRGHEVYIVLGSRVANQESFKQLGLQPVNFEVPPDVFFSDGEDMDKYLAGHIFAGTVNQWDYLTDASVKLSRECSLILDDKKFMHQVKQLQFDIVLAEMFTLNPCSVIVTYNLHIPYVAMSNFYVPWHIRLPVLPSFYAIRSPLPYWEGYTLKTSLINTGIYAIMHLFKISQLWNQTLISSCVPEQFSWIEFLLQSELFLIDSDHHLDAPLPLLPNIISVAGITVRKSKPLPKDLEEFASKSQEGIIMVSFGSTTNHFPKEIVAKFIATFSRLSQAVFAKFVLPKGVTLPKNVHLSTWLPQNDILGHSKTRLFITHCGSNGQHEALYHAVAMLGFPLFAEQSSNCDRAREKGFGLDMDIHNFTSDELYDNIMELLSNSSYRDAIKRASDRWKDEPLIGREKAAHWIEHVLKYGSDHLRSPAFQLPLYRFLMLDVIAVILSTFFFVVLVVFCCCRACCRRLRRSKTLPAIKTEKQE